MEQLYFLGILVLNVVTAVVFFNLGRTGQLPKMPQITKRQEPRSNFVDNDLEDIRDVDPKLVLKSFMESLKKPSPKAQQNVEQDFEEMIN